MPAEARVSAISGARGLMAAAVRLERRGDPSLVLRVVVPVVAAACGLAVGALVLLAGRHDPVEAYLSMWQASFGTPDGLASTAVKAVPLLFCGLAVAAALRIGLWNIGAEGQLIVGAVAATGVALYAPGLPAPLLLLAMAAAAGAAGAGWAGLAAVPRALIGLNEIIVTLFLNYIGTLLMQDLVFGPWGDPKAYGFAYSRALPAAAALPTLGDTGVHVGILVALAASAGVWWLIERTPWGFSVRVVGGNPRAARYLRLPLRRRLVAVFALSGAIAGVAGFVELAGVTNRLQEGISVNYGYTGVLIAFLARGRVPGVVLGAVLFAALAVGSYALQTTGVAQAIATVIQAVIIVFLLAGEAFLRYRVRLTRPARRGAPEHLLEEVPQ